jgi:phosphoglycolate phosphatase
MTQLLRVIWDSDGTLRIPQFDAIKSFNYVFRKWPEHQIDIADAWRVARQDIMTLINNTCVALKLSGAETEHMHEKYRSEYLRKKSANAASGYDPRQIYDGAAECLGWFSQNGVTNVLCSAGLEEPTREFYGSVRLSDLFDAMIFKSPYDAIKPMGRCLKGIGDKPAIDPANAVVIGDSADDIIAARDVGIKSIRIRHGSTLPLSPGVEANAEVEDFEGIVPVLIGWGYQIGSLKPA